MKRDSELLMEIAARLDFGDDAQLCKQIERTWKSLRWIMEQTWRADADKDNGRRVMLEHIGPALEGALRGFQRLKDHRDAPVAAPEASPAAVESAAAAPADEDGPLVPKSTEEKAELVVAAMSSKVLA